MNDETGDETRSSGDGGYVHRPNGAPGADGTSGTPSDSSADGGFGGRGWILVGIVVVATICVPGIIYLYPTAPGDLGLPFIAAMLVLPMVPAVLLGLTAVWSMTAATRGRTD